MLTFEDEVRKQGYQYIIGIDEAGRGPLAGPVVASAVLIKDYQFSCPINDSKKLSPKKREDAFQEIQSKAYVGIGIIGEAKIDEVNILQATLLAMRDAVKNLAQQFLKDNPEEDFYKKTCLLVDGNRFLSTSPFAYKTVIGGDAKVFSIACASIIAKVTRDKMLDEFDKKFPQYGFAQHKGYPTESHRKAIAQHGLSPIHRRSFNHV